jgi:hypothetical protein
MIAAMDAGCYLNRLRRSMPRVMGVSDRPPQLSRVDRIIGLYHGSTTAIEAMPEQLQASKQFPIPSLLELQRRNSSLNYEIEYYLQVEQARNEFQDVVMQVSERLQKALSEFGKVRQQVNYEKTQARQGGRADFQKDL